MRMFEAYTIKFPQLGNYHEHGETAIIQTAPGVKLTSELLTRAGREAGRLLHQAREERERQGWEEVIRPLLTEELRRASTGGITDLYLATVAKAYAFVSDYPHLKVIQTLADMLGRPVNTVKMHVVRARDRGFLSVTGAGRGEGTLTDHGERVLREQSTVPQDQTGLGPVDE